MYSQSHIKDFFPKKRNATSSSTSTSSTSSSSVQPPPSKRHKQKHDNVVVGADGNKSKMVTFSPTAEQEAIINSDLALSPGIIELLYAFAGAGKTTTSLKIAEKNADKRIGYLAFNTKMKEEAAKKFKQIRNCRVYTYHSLAHHYIMKAYDYKLFINQNGVGSYFDVFKEWLQKQKLEREFVHIYGDQLISPKDYEDENASLLWTHAQYALRAFCLSAELKIEPCHCIKLQKLIEKREYSSSSSSSSSLSLKKRKLPEVSDCVLLAQYIWDKIYSRKYKLITQDFVIKLLHLIHPDSISRDFDIIILDEAQDCMPVMIEILKYYSRFVGLVVIGDPQQQINGWMGAKNAMSSLSTFFEPSKQRQFVLSESFRFGSSIADLINQLLTRLGYALPKPIVSKTKHQTRIHITPDNINELICSMLHELPQKQKGMKKSLKVAVLSRTKLGIIQLVDSWIRNVAEKHIDPAIFRMTCSAAVKAELDQVCSWGSLTNAQIEWRLEKYKEEVQMDSSNQDAKAKIDMLRYLQHFTPAKRVMFCEKLFTILHPLKSKKMQQEKQEQQQLQHVVNDDDDDDDDDDDNDNDDDENEENEKQKQKEKTNYSKTAEKRIHIELMTIHASKGLEFNEVYMIDVESAIKKLQIAVARSIVNSTPLSISEGSELHAIACLIYVGCTRPINNLYIQNILHHFITHTMTKAEAEAYLAKIE